MTQNEKIGQYASQVKTDDGGWTSQYNCHRKKFGLLTANVDWVDSTVGYRISFAGIICNRRVQSFEEAKSLAEKFALIVCNKTIDALNR